MFTNRSLLAGWALLLSRITFKASEIQLTSIHLQLLLDNLVVIKLYRSVTARQGQMSLRSCNTLWTRRHDH